MDAKEVFESILNGIGNNLIALLLLFVLIYVVIYLFVKLRAIKKVIINSKGFLWLKSPENLDSIKKSDSVIATFITVIFGGLLFSILMIFGGLWSIWLIAFIAPYDTAKNLAVKKRDTFIDRGCIYESQPFSNCRTLVKSDGTEIIKGILVTQSSTHVAFFTDKGSSIMQIPKDARIVSEFKKVIPTPQDE